jgi:hypothetical protein
VGNRLDGESNASQPVDNPNFPSGDGVPGGDFAARFTVDSRPEVAVYSGRTVFVDTNGNNFFDPRNQIDFTDRDVVYYFGLPTDDLFVGNFATNFGGAADGFDKLAAYGNIGGSFRFLIDNNNDGVPDAFPPGKPGGPLNTAQINGQAFAGNFDGNAANGDEVGIFDGERWYLDTNHNFNVDPAEGDLVITGAIRGLPIVGDFDGNGVDDLATFNDFRNRFEIDLRGPGFGNGNIDRVLLFGFPGTNDQPVAADVNQDGIDDLGLFAPQQGAGTDEEQAFFHILVTQPGAGGAAQPLWLSNRVVNVPVPTDLVGQMPAGNAHSINFRQRPFGDDILAPFGEDFAIPLLGNFDPPVGPGTGTVEAPIGGATDTNPRNALDVNDDGKVSIPDLLVLVNDLRNSGGQHPSTYDASAPYLDVNADNMVSVGDLLPIVTWLKENNVPVPEGEGEAEPAAMESSASVVYVGVFDPAAESSADEVDETLADTGLLAAPNLLDGTLRAADYGAESQNSVSLLEGEEDDLDDILDSIADDVSRQWR